MNGKIKEIYNTMIQRTKFTDGTSRDMEKKIKELLKEEESRMESLEYEQYRGKLFQVASIAEEAGFIKGFRYAALLMAECFVQDDLTAEP